MAVVIRLSLTLPMPWNAWLSWVVSVASLNGMGIATAHQPGQKNETLGGWLSKIVWHLPCRAVLMLNTTVASTNKRPRSKVWPARLYQALQHLMPHLSCPRVTPQ